MNARKESDPFVEQRRLEIHQVANGYMVKYPTGNSRRDGWTGQMHYEAATVVFNSFPDMAEWMERYFTEDLKALMDASRKGE